MFLLKILTGAGLGRVVLTLGGEGETIMCILQIVYAMNHDPSMYTCVPILPMSGLSGFGPVDLRVFHPHSLFLPWFREERLVVP